MTTTSNHTCSSGCSCRACREQELKSGYELPHWKQRRQQRLMVALPNSEGEGETAGQHQYFRERKVLRYKPRYAPEPGMLTGGSEELMEFEESFEFETPNPVRHFHGITPKQVLRKKPKTWRVVNVRTEDGWVMKDENGNERIRYMRPNPRYKGFKQAVKWEHIKTGYWVVRDEKGNYLDGFGYIVTGDIPLARMTEDQKRNIHIPYSGVDR